MTICGYFNQEKSPLEQVSVKLSIFFSYFPHLLLLRASAASDLLYYLCLENVRKAAKQKQHKNEWNSYVYLYFPLQTQSQLNKLHMLYNKPNKQTAM